MKFLYLRQLKFEIVSYVELSLYAYKICTEILPHFGITYNNLQNDILRQSFVHAASLLANNYSSFL